MISYQREFNRHADIARYGNADDVRISYGIMVGDPSADVEEGKNFLGDEFVESPRFTTWQDAKAAKDFAECLLLVVDKHAQKNNATLITSDEIFECVSDSVNGLLEYHNHKRFGTMLIAEIVTNLNNLLDNHGVR